MSVNHLWLTSSQVQVTVKKVPALPCMVLVQQKTCFIRLKDRYEKDQSSIQQVLKGTLLKVNQIKMARESPCFVGIPYE